MMWNSGFQGASCEFETEEMWPLKGRTGSGGAVSVLRVYKLHTEHVHLQFC